MRVRERREGFHFIGRQPTDSCSNTILARYVRHIFCVTPWSGNKIRSLARWLSFRTKSSRSERSGTKFHVNCAKENVDLLIKRIIDNMKISRKQ